LKWQDIELSFYHLLGVVYEAPWLPGRVAPSKDGYSSSCFTIGGVSWSMPLAGVHHLKAVVDLSSLGTSCLLSSLLIC
ncbi:unnamed protein product, partial [Musa acuminata subsp. burmannicoides]